MGHGIMTPHTDTLIRPATPADVDSLVELASTTFRETYAEFLDAGEIEDYIVGHFTAAAFEAMLHDASSSLLVTSDSARLIGYAQMCVSEPPPCVRGESPIELCRLYLRREAIGKGHGASLMARAHAEGRRRGCRTIWLVIYDRNLRAREFYRKAGFAEVGTKDFLFGGRLYADPVMSAPVNPA
jgi:ribosomal protein S18 acetylase RimI-like enzyme